MPWDAQSFASKHNHKLKGKAARGASEAANNALASGKSDASAIRIGNYVGDRVMSHDAGGQVGSMVMPPTMGASSAYPPPPGQRKQGQRNYGKRQ